jgi:hypothetical protein
MTEKVLETLVFFAFQLPDAAGSPREFYLKTKEFRYTNQIN